MTDAELQGMVDKIIAYESATGDWQKRIILTADNADDGGDFEASSEQVGRLIPGGYTTEKVYLTTNNLAEARSNLLQDVNNGALFMNYFGHSGIDRLATEGLLTSADVGLLTNLDRYPVLTAMSCVMGQFAVPGYDCLGETLMLSSNSGAIVVWSPTGLSLNDPAEKLCEGFYGAVFQDGKGILGDAVLKALRGYEKSGMIRYMLDIYDVLGDPGLLISGQTGTYEGNSPAFWLDTTAAGNGTVNVADGWYASGSNITISACPAAHYHFVGWSGDTNGATIDGTNITVTVAQARAITAIFAIDQNTFEVNSQWGAPSPASAIYTNDYGTMITNTVLASDSLGGTQVTCLGWTMTGNIPASGTTNSFVMTQTNNAVLTWLWKTNFWLATHASGSGTVTVASGWYNAGTSVTIKATSIGKSFFIGWAGDTNGATISGPSITVKMSSAKSITANFGLISKYHGWQSLVLLEGAVVRQINMADPLIPGTTNAIQWQVESFEPVLSGVKIRLPDGGSVTNVTLNGVPMGITNGTAAIGNWQSKVYSFQADWITPNMPGTCRIRFLTARQDGYAYVNANIPDGIDARPYGPDGKEIARDISGVGTTPAIQNETLTKASMAFETINQALYRRGCVVQNIEIGDNLIPGSVTTCRWSILTYPSIQARLRVDLPNEGDFIGAGTLKASSNTWWRLPGSGKIVEYNGSVSNDSLDKVSKYYNLKQYYYQYAWMVPNDTGTCSIAFEVAPGALTNWVAAILPENVDLRITNSVAIERDVASTGGVPVVLTIGATKTAGKISYRGDANWYQFTVATTGTYRVETYLGSLTDTIMKLYGPDSQAILLDQNDNAVGRASRIIRTLDPGIYYIKITAPFKKTGTYKIIVSQ